MEVPARGFFPSTYLRSRHGGGDFREHIFDYRAGWHTPDYDLATGIIPGLVNATRTSNLTGCRQHAGDTSRAGCAPCRHADATPEQKRISPSPKDASFFEFGTTLLVIFRSGSWSFFASISRGVRYLLRIARRAKRVATSVAMQLSARRTPGHGAFAGLSPHAPIVCATRFSEPPPQAPRSHIPVSFICRIARRT